jgi:hypothetical protein
MKRAWERYAAVRWGVVLLALIASNAALALLYWALV